MWKQPKYPLIDESINKLKYIYTMEYHSIIKEMSYQARKGIEET